MENVFSRNRKNIPVFYLKFNNSNSMYNFHCLSDWIYIARKMGADYYILCDNKKLKKKILQSCKFPDSDIKFLKSDIFIPKKIIKTVSTTSWHNAARAHLTTFFHSKKNCIKEFWNIDADDTSFMLSPFEIAGFLIKVASYAKANDINIMSLDMHASRYWGKHWTFGVSYCQNNCDYISIIKKEKDLNWRKDFAKIRPHGVFNLDSYFMYLKNHNILRLASFNIDNLYFVHWGTVGFRNAYRFIQVEKGNKMYYPLGINLFGDNKFNMFPTADDVINFDFGISEDESIKYFEKKMYKFVKNNYEQCFGE